MTKQAGAACPSCRWMPCAEYAMRDEAPRWSCTNCGDGGLLAGEFTGRKTTTAATGSKPAQKKHWRDVAKGAT